MNYVVIIIIVVYYNTTITITYCDVTRWRDDSSLRVTCTTAVWSAWEKIQSILDFR